MTSKYIWIQVSVIALVNLMPRLANADECSRVRFAATQKCSEFALNAAGVNDELAKMTAQKIVQNRSLGQKYKKEFATTGAYNMRSAAEKCRNTIPECAQICGDAAYCSSEIEKMASQIDRSVDDYMKRAQ